MKHLIEALEGVFVAAAKSGGDLARTADLALNNVNWSGELNNHYPESNSVVDAHLETACASSGQDGSASHRVAGELLAATKQLKWRTSSRGRADDPVLSAFSRNYTAMTILGNGGLLPSDKITAGFNLLGPDVFYPPHAHTAEESYWNIGGRGEWKVDDTPWFTVELGDSIYHKSGALHAMRTNDLPLLSVWLWTSHLDSEVVIVRGAL